MATYNKASNYKKPEKIVDIVSYTLGKKGPSVSEFKSPVIPRRQQKYTKFEQTIRDVAVAPKTESIKKRFRQEEEFGVKRGPGAWGKKK